MRKVLLLLVGTAVLWVPAVSVAGDSSPRPSKLAAKAGTPNAKSDVSNPASTCGSQRSELNFAASHDGRMFSQFYGTTGGKGRSGGANAFGKCVSMIAKQKDKSDRKDSAANRDEKGAESRGEDSAKSHGETKSASPAITCKAMQTDDLAHFQTAYGKRPNAFGKCVAKRANGNTG